MFTVSFRIPFDLFGGRQYVNGSALSPVHLKKGTSVFVSQAGSSSPLAGAQVIESVRTNREAGSFNWALR